MWTSLKDLVRRHTIYHPVKTQTSSATRCPNMAPVFTIHKQYPSRRTGKIAPSTDEVEIEILLDRNRFCSARRQLHGDGRYEKALEALQQTLWCSHCSQMHKRVFFSAKQRAASTETRICVLAEGRAPFCTHRSLRFDSIPADGAPRAAWGAEDICRHPDHDPPGWYRRWMEALGDRPSPGYQRPRLYFPPPKMGQSFGSLLSETTPFGQDAMSAYHRP